MIPLCTLRRASTLGAISPDGVRLTELGRIADACCRGIPERSNDVTLVAHTVQPDHLHAILSLGASLIPADGKGRARPFERRFGEADAGTLPVIVRAYKAAVTRRAHRLGFREVWDRGYHESVLKDPSAIWHAREYVLGHLPFR